MTKNKKIPIIFGIILILLCSTTFFILNYEKNLKIEEYLEDKTQRYVQSYEATYRAYQKLSNAIYQIDINKESVKKIFKDATGENKDEIRVKLHNHLKKTYAVLKIYGIKQLHFHLPNNESFLRFHRPQKFGDNLTNFRETVKYVNKFKKPIDGFEEGKVYNGYRFVFPVNYEGNHLGSVEVSFSTVAMSSKLMRDYDITAPFLISKDVVDTKVFNSEKSNYIQSPIENFYIEKKTVENIKTLRKIKTRESLSESTNILMKNQKLFSKTFSIYEPKRKDIMTFIKVKNPITKKVVGMLVMRSSADYIFNKKRNFYISFFVLVLLITVILLLIYKELEQKSKLKLDIEKAEEVNIKLHNLNNQIKEEIAKNREKDKQIFQQSKLAQMGEMLSMIAHQWRQPLTAIGATSIAINIKARFNELESEDIINKTERISEYAQHLSATINDFRDFFKSNKEKKEVTYSELIKSVLGIIEISIKNKDIKLVKNLNCGDKFETYPNEIKQVILNLLKNAEDVVLDNKIKNPTIKILTYKDEEKYILEISDNGGGVPDDVIDNIFDPYFSTKTNKDGTGLGLYMSKTIIEEHCEGKLIVKNDAEGAVFKIIL